MKEENGLVSGPSGKITAFVTPGGGTDSSSDHAPPCAAGIDFHSPEFNQADDLNDGSGNYRSFQPLNDVITADMRHQAERKRLSTSVDSLPGEVAAFKKREIKSEKPGDGKEAAPLFILSQGRLLIVDSEVERARALGTRLNDQGLTCTLVITGGKARETSFPGLGRSEPLKAEALAVTGAFGGFSVTLTVNGDQQPLTKGVDSQPAVFDLVLDLQPVSSYAGEGLPLGYYAPMADSADLAQVIAELPEMRGQFKKPRFISFLNNRCLHGLSRVQDCHQCISVCPFGAIRSTDRKISFDHYLCQGCGACALVCPAEAVELNEPSRGDLLQALRTKLKHHQGFPSTLVIADKETAWGTEEGHDHLIFYKPEQIAYIGLEMLLSALAFGTEDILILLEQQTPLRIRKAVEGQVEIARAVLEGLKLEPDRIRIAGSSGPRASESAIPQTEALEASLENSQRPWPPFSFDPVPGPDKTIKKRSLIRQATQHLYDRSGAGEPSLPLPAGSSFGVVTIDAAVCTVCLACASACPSGALSAGGQMPRLLFQESLCHQCGLCQETCPENALTLLPRLLCDPAAIQTPIVLKEVEPFGCIECGRPFAPPAMIDHIQKKLQGHWMYAEARQLRRLQMCRTCRTRDALTSLDMKTWNLS